MIPNFNKPARSPMPSRPSLPPPTPPKGAKRIEVRKLSDSPFGEEVKKKHSKKWMIVIIVLLLCVFAGLMVLIVKTGVYQVPYFSALYKERPVTRVVIPASLTVEQLSDRMQSAFVKPTSTKDGTVRIAFTEQEVSRMLAYALSRSPRNGIRVESSQAVILPTGVEVTAVVQKNGVKAKVFALVLPLVDQGRVSIVMKELAVGNLSLPASAASQIKRMGFGSEADSWKLDVGPYSIKEVRLGDGSAELIFASSVKK